MIKFHTFVGVIALSMSLTACDFFSAEWEAEDGACMAVSSERTMMATIRRDGIAFVDLEPGCTNHLDGLGSRFTEIEINGDRYTAMVMCNDATHNRNITTIGTFTMAVKEKGALAALSAKAAAEFTGILGAKVTLEGQTAHFYKGNFASVCPNYLPRPPASGESALNKPAITLGDLQQRVNDTPHQPAVARPAQAAVQPITPSLDTLPPEIYDQALARAQSTYLLAHPGTDLSDMAWEQIHRPVQEVNSQMMRILRYTTFNPATGVTSDVDVEIAPDGTVGYAINNDRTSPSTTVTAPPPTRSPADHTINAFCTLNNGKTVSVYAAEGQDYRYTYLDKSGRQELELVDGLFGVKAFHYYTPLGMGAAHYIRFNKGTYDYVLLSKDTGKEEFYGLQVYNNGDLISSRECKTALTLDTKDFSPNDHSDSEKMGNYFIY